MNWSKYIGIPYVRDSSSSSGCDCWGLVQLVYREKLSLEIGSATEQGPALKDHRWKEIPLSQVKPFDVLVLRGASMARHVGLIVDRTRMLHACQGLGSGLDRFGGVLCKSQITAAYRHHLL